MTESLLRVCRSCDRYTLLETCSTCHRSTRSPHPARYSPEDRYGVYRRRLFAEVARQGIPEAP
jgi:H/ACA ribonucleoprotein complex subunit 3